MDEPAAPDESDVNQDATQDEDTRSLLPRLLIAPIAILIATVMIGLPVLRILTADGGEPSVRRDAASDARGRVAALFASAVLESRSAVIAGRYAHEDVHPRMEAIIIDLQQRDPAQLERAVATTARVTCPEVQPGQECFQARLGRAGEEPVAEIRFAVGIVNGIARVVSIEQANVVLLGGDRRGA